MKYAKNLFGMLCLSLAAAAWIAPAPVHAVGLISYLYRAPLRWADDAGRNVALADWQGRPVIVTMAFSTCRRICSDTMLRLQEIQRVLDARGKSAEIVVISYDAEGDDPQAWAQYRKNRNLMRSNWHFLVGNKTDTRRLARMLGFDYWFIDTHVVHDFKIVVLDDNGVMQREIGPGPQDFERLF